MSTTKFVSVTDEAKTVGTVDKNGVLWKSTSVGELKGTVDGISSCWEAIYSRCTKSPERLAAGYRTVLTRELEQGKFEKFTLSPDYTFITYGQYLKRVEAFATGLQALTELPVGGYVVIYAETQLSWMVAAFAAWRQGLTVVTIYATLGEEGTEYGINQCKATTVVADAKLLKVLAKVAGKCPSLKHVITITEDIPDNIAAELQAANIAVTSMSALEGKGATAVAARPPATDAVAVLMYTSGTTGLPKGVEITHANMLCVCAATFSPSSAILSNPNYFKFSLDDDPTYLCYLPLAHIMELAVEVTLLYEGCKLCYGSPHTLTPTSLKMKQTVPPQVGDAQAAMPTIMVFAPAVLDKVYAKVNSMFAEKPGCIRALIARGFRKGFANFDAGGVGSNGFPEKLIFKKVQKLLGGRVSLALTGSAPLAPDVQKWVQTVFNCPCRQGYGLTETAAATCITLASDNSISTVGPPQECACIRLRDWPEGRYFNEDINDPKVGMRRGEILIGGPMVCKGYYTNPDNPDPEIVEKNATEFVTIDGIRYFCTGDIGQFTPEGNVQIIDRKKDLVKLQQGEYVALSKVENVLKTSKYVELPMAYAISTASFCIALVCPMAPALKSLAAELGVQGDMAALCENEAIIDAVLKDLQACCKKGGKLVTFEIPQKVILIPELWTPENDMLTAAMKLKRKPIVERHAKDIEKIGYV